MDGLNLDYKLDDKDKVNNCYCFLFNKNEIIFKEHNNFPEFLLTSEAEELGINISRMIYIGSEDDNEYYAANINEKDNIQDYSIKELRQLYGEVCESIFFLALRGLHFVNWLSKTNYCSNCGNKVQVEHKKTYIECSNCGNLMYSFINPCIIVAVLKEDKILLARSPHFMPNMYSLISGYVEAGEFIDTAVKREVKEEVGIEIKNIKYLSSYPWPFSNSLMLGFIAEYESGEIVVDNNEIEAAEWFSLDNLPNLPSSKLSYARMIIDYLLESR